jgi:ABC-type dipeptide/oligopeptide/nickel transport system ATPase subunit
MLIEFNGIGKSFRTGTLIKKRVEVLHRLSFCISEGETVGILGDSGSGKSTICQIAAGLIKYDKGTILYRGEELTYPFKKPYRREIQILFQQPETVFNPKLKISASINEVYRILEQKPDSTTVNTYFKPFGIYTEHLEKYPAALSGGELQRLALARALVLGPKFLILDEPTSMLDSISQAQILNMLKRLQKEKQLTFLYITHNHTLAELFCDKVYFLKNGNLYDGARDDR